MTIVLQVITDESAGLPGALALLDRLEAARSHVPFWDGRVGILLRAPDASDSEYREVGAAFVSRAKDLRILPVVHGERGESLVAKDPGVGVHFPEREWRARSGSLPSRQFVSAACHDEEGAASAAARGATSLLLSPIFETPGKGPPLGIRAITRARFQLPWSARLFALGGIDVTNAALARAAGAQGIAVVSAVASAADPALAITRLLHRFYGRG